MAKIIIYLIWTLYLSVTEINLRDYLQQQCSIEEICCTPMLQSSYNIRKTFLLSNLKMLFLIDLV